MKVASISGPSWEAMIGDVEKYMPIIERLVGFYLLHDHRGDPDHDSVGNDAVATVPGLRTLSASEREFVRAGAQVVYYQDDPGFAIRQMIRDWVAEGAPS